MTLQSNEPGNVGEEPDHALDESVRTEHEASPRPMEQLALPIDLGAIEDWSLASHEKALIMAVLPRVGYNLTRASARLDIDRRTLQRKLIRHGLYEAFKRERRTNGSS